MTNEQFIKFKQDFKTVVEETKIKKKYRKEWWNLGFKSEKESYQAYTLDLHKIEEQLKNVLIYDEKSYYNKRILGHSIITHWTYYCVKHKLDKPEIEQYVKEQHKKLKEEKRNSLQMLYIPTVLKQIEKIISKYEEF